MKPRIEPAEWWRTAIVDIERDKINIRGYPIARLIGTISFSQMVWLMLRGEMPSAEQAALLEATLVAGVDHGPQAPSIAVARMAATCGIGLNNAVASAVNVLGDVHGGAGQECLEVYELVAGRLATGEDLDSALDAEIGARLDAGRHLAGFGHRFHRVDPRSVRLLDLLDAAVANGVVAGTYATIGRGIEAYLARRKGRPLPMNVDGATAIIFGELGFPAPLARGLFILSRSVGVLAHAWEQVSQGERIKGPMPPSIPYTYTGSPERGLPESGQRP